jgi:POT family proton-dependent oligopeptide transporter
MLISLVIYLSGRAWLPDGKNAVVKAPADIIKKKLTQNERHAIYVLLFMLPILAIGSVGNQQIFNAYLLWVPKNVDLIFFGRAMPTTWLITVDAVVSVSALFLSLMFWRWWAKHFKEPSEIIKMCIGLSLSAGGLAALTMAALAASSGQKADIAWVLAFEVLNSFGFANLMPVGIALYARAAPKAVAGTMMGVYYLHLFMGNNLVGWLGGLVERMSGTQFWLVHVSLVGAATLLMCLIARFFGHLLIANNSGGAVIAK